MVFRDLIVIILLLLTVIAGTILRILKRTQSRWNLLLFIPLLASILHFLLSGRNVFMYLVYFASILVAFTYGIRKKKGLSIAIAIFASVLSVLPVVLTMISNSNCYASLDYVKAFQKFHKDMEKQYALQDYKNVNFKEKYDKYLSLFEDAEKNKDKTAYVNALRQYMASYQDGHVQLWDMYENFGIGSTKNIQNANQEILPNYYGMTLMKLDSGEYIAANVKEGGSADLAGISDGMVITSWNGETVSRQGEKIESLLPVNAFMFADVENIERFKPFYIACNGGKRVAVSFQDYEGKTKRAELISMGNGYAYMYDTIGRFFGKSSLDKEHSDLEYRTLNHNTGYLRVSGMGSDYEGIRNQMDGYIEQMEKDKVSSLIIDARNNEGGDDKAGAILTEYFAKEDMQYLTESIYNPETKEYMKKRTIDVNAKGRIDLPVIILVNSQCISAGEGFVYNMNKLDQVTIAGMTGTNGSFGTIDGVDIMPEGLMAVYPSIACIDENGEIMIDSKAGGTGGIKPEILIPIDREAVSEIFDETKDYELEYLLQN